VTYVRPDLGVTQLGASGQYVFNHEKFSFKAAFQNTELQKRSAGSWLLGWNMFYGSVTADSSLVPGFLQSETPDYDRLRFLKAGPVVGYAYTLVMLEKFYLSGAADLAISCGMYSLKLDRAKFEEFYVSVDYGLRFAVGYNTSRLNIGAFYVVQKVQVESNYHNIISTGNFRFIVAYRFAKKHIPIFD
jgi:hypothetical protein